MRWKEITLSEASTLAFGDGSCATISWWPRPRRGEPEGLAKVELPSREVVLPGVVDNGETVSKPRVFVVYGERPDAVLLLGGPTAYRLSSSGSVEESFDLYRETALAEYWETRLAETALGMLVVYESGVLLLDKGLRVVWHERKYLNDFFCSVEEQRLNLVRDNETEWSLSLVDGSVVEP